MTPLASAVLRSWSVPAGPTLVMLAMAALYLRGFARLHRLLPERFPPWRRVAFLTGLASVFVAIASPLDAFAGWLLQVHMVQHIVLMLIAPPLLVAGAPAMPFLRALPPGLVKHLGGPLFASRPLRRAAELLAHPVACWLVFVGATWLWHAPAMYELALRSPFWHAIEHATFLATATMFWWPVVAPWPSRPRWPRWAIALYLLLADLQSTALCATLVFSERVLYPSYTLAPRLGGSGALADQIAAGALMWVPASLAFLVPAVVIVFHSLAPAQLAAPRAPAMPAVSLLDEVETLSLPARPAPPAASSAPGLDLLRVPVLGAVLGWRHFRTLAQSTLLLLVLAIVADGVLGSPVGALNLAGVVPWTYGRGIVVIALLVFGNAFCMACPFMLPRAVARRLGGAGRSWPRRLRTKWIAVALLVAFFVAYEWLALWDRPAATAWLLVAYFAAALVVDSVFRGASFCKYVCPIGQFQFVHSLVSPFEVKVRDVQACASCTTHDCLRGNGEHRGCELELFLPRKAGSLDCTFCLDCVHACPHDNVGILAVAPAAELARDHRRSAVGRLSERTDVVVLALVLVVAAFASAAAMIGPVTTAEERLARVLDLRSVAPLGAALMLLAVTAGPVLVLAIAAPKAPALRRRLALALVPLGATMWAAHLFFHLMTGAGSGTVAFARALGAAGLPLAIDVTARGASPIAAERLLGCQILLLDAGLLVSLYAGWRIVRPLARSVGSAVAMVLPWAIAAATLYAAGVWIFLQPMEMRGVMLR